MQNQNKQSAPLYKKLIQKKTIRGVYDLSLGISIVVAILLGVGLGYLMFKITNIRWLFWLGLFWGIGGAILNLYKAYQRAQKELKELAQDPKYTYKPTEKKDV